MNSTLAFLALNSFLSLETGLYICPGNPDICDQDVRVYQSGKQITALKVEYVGYCGSMGPYLYPCKNAVCTDGNAEFVLNSRGGYAWKNLGHPFRCEFRKKRPGPE
ncbi:MAG: hypothetical protein KGP28_12845 [Bdellovibrionales bacterium]|nr:hypothetical protein [Bdellovibrionales bacterium]